MDTRSFSKKSESLFFCKTLKIGSNIGVFKFSCLLEKPKNALFGNIVRYPDILDKFLTCLAFWFPCVFDACFLSVQGFDSSWTLFVFVFILSRCLLSGRFLIVLSQQDLTSLSLLLLKRQKLATKIVLFLKGFWKTLWWTKIRTDYSELFFRNAIRKFFRKLPGECSSSHGSKKAIR